MARCGCAGSAVCACFFENGDGTTYEGTGSQDNPYSVNVVYSEDEGNAAGPGSDGGIYASSDVDCDQVRPCVSVDPNGPMTYDESTGVFNTQISNDPGNATTQGSDGGIFSAGGAVPILECGLEPGDQPDSMRVQTAEDWGEGSINFACDERNGSPVYCDVDGNLRTVPPQARVYEQNATAGIPAGQGQLIDCNGVDSGEVTVTITNISACRFMGVRVDQATQANIRFDHNSGRQLVIRHAIEQSTQGGPFTATADFASGSPMGGIPASESASITRGAEVAQIPPGATFTQTIRTNTRINLPCPNNNNDRPTLFANSVALIVTGATF